MCHRSSYYKGRGNHSLSKEDWMRFRFYKHLRLFLFVNIFFFVSGFNGGAYQGWKWAAVFWGVGLLMHYQSVKHALSKPHKSDDDELVDDIPPDEEQASWNNKDLV